MSRPRHNVRLVQPRHRVERRPSSEIALAEIAERGCVTDVRNLPLHLFGQLADRNGTQLFGRLAVPPDLVQKRFRHR